MGCRREEKLGMGLGFRVSLKPVGEIQIKIENSILAPGRKWKFQLQNPCPGPAPFTALYSEVGVRPDLRERPGDRMRAGDRREGGLSMPCHCDITTPAGGGPRKRPCQTRCLTLAEIPSKFISEPWFPSLSNVKVDERSKLMVNTY